MDVNPLTRAIREAGTGPTRADLLRQIDQLRAENRLLTSVAAARAADLERLQRRLDAANQKVRLLLDTHCEGAPV